MKKMLAWTLFKQIKRIAPDDFSLCLLNTKLFYHGLTQLTCSKLTMKTAKKVWNLLRLTIKTSERLHWCRSGVFIVLTLNRFHTLFWCLHKVVMASLLLTWFCYFHCWIWTSKCRLGSLRNQFFLTNLPVHKKLRNSPILEVKENCEQLVEPLKTAITKLSILHIAVTFI